MAALYLALFGAFGTEGPFFPAFLAVRNLTASEIGIVLAAGTVVRLIVGPPLGILADTIGLRRVLIGAAIGAGLVILLYLLATGFWMLLGVAALHAIAVTSLNPLCDAVAVEAARRERVFSYGWVRGVGSSGYIVATLASGFLVSRFGIASALVAAGVLFLLMVPPLLWVPGSGEVREAPGASAVIFDLLASRPFVRLLCVAALIIGSHVMSNTFAIIHWQHAGVPAKTISLLWSTGLLAEVAIFISFGPRLLRTFGVARCAMTAALAGIARWSILALSVSVPFLAVSQALQGLTFALTHLACMSALESTVPSQHLGTAQSLYATLAIGGANAVLTLLSGFAFEAWGAHAFLTMAALCLVAVPISAHLGERG